MSQPQQPRQLRIELPPDLTAIYANVFVVRHTHSEIILDAIQLLPADIRARVLSRVVMTPANAKLLLRALEENLKKFEEKHGEIDVPPQPPSLADQLFAPLRPADEDSTDEV